MEDKQRHLDHLDGHFSAISTQLLKFDELQYDILTQMDPRILKKFDQVKAHIQVCRHN